MTIIIDDQDTVEIHPDTHTASLFGGDPARTADDGRVVIENAAQPGAAEAGKFTKVVPVDVAEIRDGQAVVSYAATEAILADLRTMYEGKRYDLSIPAQAEEAHDGSRKLMKLRTGLEKLRKAHKAPAIELGKKIDTEAERITKEIVTLEKAIDDQIEAEKKRVAEEEAERARLAEERRLKFEADIGGIRAYVEHAKGLPSDRIERGIDLVEAMTFGEEWAEFGSPAALAQVETLKAMRELLSATLAREKIEAEAAAERERLARVAEAQSVENARLEQLRQSIEAQQAALAKQLAEFKAREDAAEAARVQALRDAEAKAQAEAKAKADAESRAVAEAQARADAAVAQQADDEDRIAKRGKYAAFAQAPAPVSRILYGDEPIDDQSYTPLSAAPAPAVEPPSAAGLPETAGPETAAWEDKTDTLRPVEEVDQVWPNEVIEELNLPEPPGYFAAVLFAEAPAPATDEPPITIGTINERLGFTVTARFLENLGFAPTVCKAPGTRFAATHWPLIKDALIAHIEALA